MPPRPHTTRSRSGHGYTQSLYMSDDMGVISEDAFPLREQMFEMERENERDQIKALKEQLAQRPPIDQVQSLQREYRNLELILQGTQRENEKCMAELEKSRLREKQLEKELASLAGEGWQKRLGLLNANESVTAIPNAPREQEVASPATSDAQGPVVAHLEQVRLLILGMDERLNGREAELRKLLSQYS